MHAAGRKDHPLSMRLPEGDIAIIDRAADLRGRSRTDFVRDAAVRAAEEVLMESTLLRMTPEGFEALRPSRCLRPRHTRRFPEMGHPLHRKAPWEKGAAKR